MDNFKPKLYQQQFADHIIRNKKSFGIMDLGEGKTASTLLALNYLFHDLAIKGALVVAPLEVARLTWPTEVKKWSQFRWMKTALIHGPAIKRLKKLSSKADVYITNYENLTWLAKILKSNNVEDWPFDTIVFDESSKMKDPSTQRFKAWKSLFEKFKYSVLLSGTPRPNSALDLWSQIYMLDQGGSLSRNFGAFRTAYGKPVDRMGYVWKVEKNQSALINKKIKHFVYAVPEHLKPNKIPANFHNIVVKISKDTYKKYEILEKKGMLAVNGESQKFIAISKMGKCKQLTGGAVYHGLDELTGEYSKEYDIFHGTKLDALGETMKLCPSAIITYEFGHERDRILERFPEVTLFAGKNTADIMEGWNNGEIKYILCHPQSKSQGLNLQFGGHCIIWYGLPWSYENYYQMIGRIRRTHQKNTVQVYRILAENTIDFLIEEVLRHKESGMDMFFQALQAYKEGK